MRPRPQASRRRRRSRRLASQREPPRNDHGEGEEEAAEDIDGGFFAERGKDRERQPEDNTADKSAEVRHDVSVRRDAEKNKQHRATGDAGDDESLRVRGFSPKRKGLHGQQT